MYLNYIYIHMYTHAHVYYIHIYLYIYPVITYIYPVITVYEHVIFTRRIKNLSLGHKPISGISEAQSEGIQRPYP